MKRLQLAIYFAASSIPCTVITYAIVRHFPEQMERLLRLSAAAAATPILTAIAFQVVVQKRWPHMLGTSGACLCAIGTMFICIMLGVNFAFGAPDVYVPAVGMLAFINGVIFLFSVPGPAKETVS